MKIRVDPDSRFLDLEYRFRTPIGGLFWRKLFHPKKLLFLWNLTFEMMKATSIIVVVLVLISLVEGQQNVWLSSAVCKATFREEIPWDPDLYLCDYKGFTWKNTWGPYASSFSSCIMTMRTLAPENVTLIEDVTFKSMGKCGCPSNCSQSFRGTCSGGLKKQCECSEGYSGVDCVSVSCDLGQSCSGKGSCQGVSVTPGLDVCSCTDGFSGVDCSAPMGNPPPIQQTLDIPQYTSWDEYGDNNPLFDEGSIAVINVEMNPEDLKFFMKPENTQTREYAPVNLTFTNAKIQERMENVGMRPKGGGSRSFVKKSWKLSFSKFDSGRRWYQQKQMSLKAQSMSPSYIRERWSRDLLYSMGAPAQRMSYAQLFINGEYRGVFDILEEINEQFLNSRFGNNDGGLWKDSFGAGFQWNGSRCEDYPPALYEPKTEWAEDNCQALVQLIDIINNTPMEIFEETFSKVFDVEFFMRSYAVEVLTGNWDGIMDGNNLYMYYDRKADPPLWKYIRYDLDVSLGIVSLFGVLPDFTETIQTGNVYEFGQTGVLSLSKIMLSRIMSVSSYREIFENYMTLLMDGFYNVDQSPPSPFVQRINAMQTSVTPLVRQDDWHRLDFLFSYEMFESNLAEEDILRTRNIPQTPNNDPQLYCEEAYRYATDRLQTARQQIAAGYPGNPLTNPKEAVADFREIRKLEEMRQPKIDLSKFRQ